MVCFCLHHWGLVLPSEVFRHGPWCGAEKVLGETAPSRGRRRRAPGGAATAGWELGPAPFPGAWPARGGAQRTVYPLLSLAPAENKAAWLWEVARQLGDAGGGRGGGGEAGNSRPAAGGGSPNRGLASSPSLQCHESTARMRGSGSSRRCGSAAILSARTRGTCQDHETHAMALGDPEAVAVIKKFRGRLAGSVSGACDS